MVSLPSSSENRIADCVQELVIALVKQSGNTWSEICEVRCRWGIAATTEVPPRMATSSVYTPAGSPENVPVGEEGFDEWSEFIGRWGSELDALHDKIIPEDCHYGHIYESLHAWCQFLSACILYDPPDDKLDEYASRRLIYRTGLRGSPYDMTAAPIRHLRDHNAAENAWVAVLNRFVNNLIQRQKQEPEKDIEELIRDTFRSRDHLVPLGEYLDNNPAIPFIEVQPWHREDDIRNAFRMIRETQEERPRRGRRNRDQLQAVQCAIFADRYGWTEDQVSKHFGWENYGKAGKYIREGRRILSAS
jgi:hypothetical protein